MNQQLCFWLGVYVSRSVVSDSLWPPGSSVHGIFQARILEWVAIFLLQGIFLTQGMNLVKTPLTCFLNFRPCHAACGVLVPQPGTERVPPALGAQSLNHWTTREASQLDIFFSHFIFFINLILLHLNLSTWYIFFPLYFFINLILLHLKLNRQCIYSYQGRSYDCKKIYLIYFWLH